MVRADAQLGHMPELSARIALSVTRTTLSLARPSPRDLDFIHQTAQNTPKNEQIPDLA